MTTSMDKNNCDSGPSMDFESVLYREVRPFGRFQMITLVLLTFPVIMGAIIATDYIFTIGSLPHRCAIPECDGPEPEYSPLWIANAIPISDSSFDNCNRFGNATDGVVSPENNEVCPATLFNGNETISCESYVYERTNTAVYDFNIECQEWLRALPGTLNSAGGLVALIFAGFISDRFGRRISILFFSFNVALTGVIRAFSVNLAMYATMQFLQTAIGGGAFSAAYILAAEIVGPEYRVRTSAIISSTFASGQVLLGLLAFLIPAWRTLTLVLYTPCFLIISYYWILPESYRWLLSQNMQKEGKAAIEYAARLNGKHISDENISFLLTEIPRRVEENKRLNDKNILYRVIKSPVLFRRCCTTPFLWITATFIYYGLSINSVGLSGNIYINFMAIAAVEIPGFWTAVFLLDRIGRRITLFGGFFICAVCCASFAFVSKDHYAISLFLYLTGKYCIGLVMTSVYLFTAELYPTRNRHVFLGFSSMLGRIGSIVAPLTPPLMVYWSGIPSMMFAGTAFISSLLVLTQPETRGLKVPDTIEDAECLGRNQ